MDYEDFQIQFFEDADNCKVSATCRVGETSGLVVIEMPRAIEGKPAEQILGLLQPDDAAPDSEESMVAAGAPGANTPGSTLVQRSQLQASAIRSEGRPLTSAETHPPSSSAADHEASGAASIDLHTLTQLHTLGEQMFEGLFQPEVLVLYRKMLQYCDDAKRGLRVRLCFSGADTGLQAVPWELLRDPVDGDYLARSERLAPTTLVRSIRLPGAAQGADNRSHRIWDLKILVASASPKNAPPLFYDAEEEQLKLALSKQRGIEVAQLPHVTKAKLDQTIQEIEPDIFHFTGHGGFLDANGPDDTGCLLFEDDDGNVDLVTADTLDSLLRRSAAGKCQLVVLNSCDGAEIEKQAAAFSGVAQSLLRRSFPAVVAMQASIADTVGIEFSRMFYSSLVTKEPVDRVIGDTRRKLFATANVPVEWAAPVLYLYGQNGNLFTSLRQLLSRTAVALLSLLLVLAIGIGIGYWFFGPKPLPNPVVVSWVAAENNFVVQLAWNQDSKAIVTAGWDGMAKIWDVGTQQDQAALRAGALPSPRAVLKPYKSIGSPPANYRVNAANWSPDGSELVTASSDGVLLWKVSNKSVTRVLTDSQLFADKGAVNDAEFSHDGKMIVSAGVDGAAKVWDATTGNRISTLVDSDIKGQKSHSDQVTAATFRNDQRYVATSSRDGTAKIWDTQSWQLTRPITVPPGSPVESVVWSPDGSYIVTGNYDDPRGTYQIWPWDGTTNQPIWKSVRSATVLAVSYSTRGDYLAAAIHETASSPGMAEIWNVRNVKDFPHSQPSEVANLCYADSGQSNVRVETAVFSPDEQFIATATNYGVVRLWRVSTLIAHPDSGCPSK